MGVWTFFTQKLLENFTHDYKEMITLNYMGNIEICCKCTPITI